MKFPSINSTQARIVLLIGALALAAAVNAVMGIITAARFQQQLGELQIYTQLIQNHVDAQTSLQKQRTAIKNILASGEASEADLGELYRQQEVLNEYRDAYTLPGAAPDAAASNFLQSSAEFDHQLSAFIAKAQDPAIPTRDLLEWERANLDPSAAALEPDLQTLAAGDLQALRDQISSMEASTQFSTLAGQVAMILLALMIVWGMFAAFDISRPLEVLTSAIVAFENKTYKPQMLLKYTRRPDELGKLALAVGDMAQSINEANQLKEQFLQSAQRFIPSQYLEFLEKDSITKVRLGDHVSAEMAVMFSDIRGFTTLSEKMTARENFDFVNEYLKLVSPIIQKHEGFIVKFLGDGMMAIFPYGVADAVQAGIEKQIKVEEFNHTLRERGLPNITVGIGIHTGKMMVGMIGEELRMQGDAFSDDVNLTARIEGLNKFFSTSMIISEDILRQLEQPAEFKMRRLGKVIVKGRVTPLGMYEVYHGLPGSIVAAREATRTAFEQAVDLYTRGNFVESGQLFSQVLEKDPGDKTARFYLESCAERAGQPLPPTWDGALVMDAK